MLLDHNQFNQIISLISALVTTEGDRETLVQGTFYGESIVGTVDYSGRSVGFMSNCIAHLEPSNGDTALVQPPQTLCDHYLGDDRKSERKPSLTNYREYPSVWGERKPLCPTMNPLFRH